MLAVTVHHTLRSKALEPPVGSAVLERASPLWALAVVEEPVSDAIATLVEALESLDPELLDELDRAEQHAGGHSVEREPF